MAFSYSTTVTNLKVRDQVNSEGVTLSNAVVQTYWKRTGTDADGNEGSFSGATPFTAENVPAGSFIAFEDLEESTVVGWINAVIDADAAYKAHIDEQIQKQIDDGLEEDRNPPWVVAEEAPAQSDADPDAPAE